MAANVEGDDPMPGGEISVYLLGPAEVALRQAVHEQKRGPVRIAPLPGVEPQPSATPNLVRRHRLGPGGQCVR